MQHRRHSLIESLSQVLVGAVISWLFTFYALPYFWGLEPSRKDAAWITVAYMALSLIRSYVIRRIGNAWSGWTN